MMQKLREKNYCRQSVGGRRAVSLTAECWQCPAGVGSVGGSEMPPSPSSSFEAELW